MPRDERTYITVHDGMPEHPKIEGLSDAAFRLVVETWCWCSRNRTDGKIKAASWLKRGTAKARAELIAIGLVEPDGDDWIVHDYTQHQRTAAEIDELKARRRAAGARGGKATANARASARASATPNAQANLQQSRSKSAAETETELTRHTSSKDERADALKSASRFDEFWDNYPRKVAKPEALKAFTKATARADADAIVKGAQRYRDDPNREDAYTAHAATWLNRDGWDDDPLPSRLRPAVNDSPRRPNGWEFGMGD